MLLAHVQYILLLQKMLRHEHALRTCSWNVRSMRWKQGHVVGTGPDQTRHACVLHGLLMLLTFAHLALNGDEGSGSRRTTPEDASPCPSGPGVEGSAVSLAAAPFAVPSDAILLRKGSLPCASLSFPRE